MKLFWKKQANIDGTNPDQPSSSQINNFGSSNLDNSTLQISQDRSSDEAKSSLLDLLQSKPELRQSNLVHADSADPNQGHSRQEMLFKLKK
jgi:hypothetical protein